MSNKFEALKHHVENSDSGSSEDDLNNGVLDLGPIEYPPNEHRLQHPYCLWYSRRPVIGPRNAHIQGSQGYSQALRLVGQVGTVEQWWALYSHIIRLQDLPPHTDLHLFKKGIQPMWEDPANSKGGKWVIRVRKGQVSRAWENLCMAMLGEQFMAGNEICGVVVSVRYQEDMLSIWNRTASDQMMTARIRDALKRLLNLPLTTTMEYKTHNDSLNAVADPEVRLRAVADNQLQKHTWLSATARSLTSGSATALRHTKFKVAIALYKCKELHNNGYILPWVSGLP